ncbi:MAG: TonB-dependent receptor [Chitinophagaceae bacterium]
MKPIIIALLAMLCAYTAQSQHIIKGKIFDARSKEPLQGATITDKHNHGASSDINGNFSLTSNDSSIIVSFSNYQQKEIIASNKTLNAISLEATGKELQQVVVSASRIFQKRTEVPVAINTISQQTIADTKANRLDYLVNKVSGVFMVNLGNEQHEMSIRQPMTTRSMFLYLEDGLPIRTTGIYNHNAMLEMNMAAMKQIEIIKGPASSQYGAEAIGGAVNIITQASPAVAEATISLQASNNGYKRTDIQAGNTFGKSGFLLSGYYANRNNGPVDATNFHKTAITLRNDNKISDKTSLINSITYVDYYSDMGGGSLDSVHFNNRNYSTLYTFNYRKTTALRIRSQLNQQWNNNSQTQVSIAYRNNSVKQNPSYYVTNNFTNASLANGQLNNSSFNSYILLAQHTQKISWMNSRLSGGVSVDISPSTYVANYIKIQRDSKGRYVSYNSTDSLLSNYSTGINNYASYLNYEFSPLKRLKAVIAVRYDYYHFNFNNHLPASASTGAPSTIKDFTRFTPKLGLTYNYKQLGFYANYSEGYVPPQVTELFNSVKVPYLQPQNFYNYEIGGWLSLVKNKLYADYSFYLMNGKNEIISVRLDDGSYQNQNAGKTRHIGIEYGVTYKPTSQWMFRVSATNANHTFIQDIEKGVDYSGHQMAAAPHFIANTELQYKPNWLKGFRMGIEWQHQGSYFMDNANTAKYPGFETFNARAGYTFGRFETWINALNILDHYYAVLASKSTYGYTYSLGDPREFTLGFSVHLGK